MRLSNWGLYPCIETDLRSPGGEEEALALASAAESLVGRGLGRCYGDSALNSSLVVSTLRMDRLLSFDAETGLLEAEAGVSLATLADVFAPRGWFVPTTPGTKFVTLGGAVASDVHGKNHHVAGTFGQHVRYIDIITAEQGVVRCSPKIHADLFHATCGGHGLTGLVVRVAVQMVRIPSVWIRQRGIRTRNLAEIMAAFEEYASSTFTVAWIDCLQSGASMGRSYLMCGEFAEPESLGGKSPFVVPPVHALSVPFHFPSLALNSLSVKAFNALYYGKAPAKPTDSLVNYNTFFYPLDAIHHWNRIYGHRGFTQYQFVIPRESAAEGLPKVLKRIANSGLGSFLAVLKLFGKQTVYNGNISFPKEGFTLALDFPITSGLFPVLDELDRMVLDFGGRHYLTKDVRLSAQAMRQGYGAALDEFLAVKAHWDPNNHFRSVQSQRLALA